MFYSYPSAFFPCKRLGSIYFPIIGLRKSWLSLCCDVIPFQPLPLSQYNLLARTLPHYNMLRSHVKKKLSILSSPSPPPDLPVPANEKLVAWVGDEIVTRESAKVLISQHFKVSCQ